MANGQWFFHLSQQQRYYLVLARKQLFHQLLLLKCSCICGIHICREPSGTVWLFGHFAHVKFFKNKFTLGSKFHGGNHPWKLDLLKIKPVKYFSHENLHVYGSLKVMYNNYVPFCSLHAPLNYIMCTHLHVTCTSSSQEWHWNRTDFYSSTISVQHPTNQVVKILDTLTRNLKISYGMLTIPTTSASYCKSGLTTCML